ncbi:UbiH/UbiF family hydroxylase [Robbsia andropogonis]|uniref:UbiH/UbiF family hydroxylase n=2 Tax=Robbsia andropogonis TaxID=28092 RepID=UPI002A6A2DD6|nr:UbiH/UbiF family hydroxylase [Robbsia andropogonis]
MSPRPPPHPMPAQKPLHGAPHSPLHTSRKAALPQHAIVVGGGLVGKAAALALSQSGLRVALLAPQAAPLPADQPFDQRVYALSASSQALFERLRVWQALDPERLGPVSDMRVLGDGTGALHFSAFQAAVPQLAHIVESLQVENALDAALRFQPQLTWLNARAQGLQIDPVRSDKPALLTLDDGRTLEAELIVGADGAHSWVRAQIGASVERRDYAQTGVVANFRISLPHAETAWQWFRDGEIIALLPMAGPYVSLVWSAETDHAQRLVAQGGDVLAAELERLAGATHGTFECVTSPVGFPLALQRVDKLIAPRVALVGDAAHLIHPLAGQGVNLGLRDVAALTDVLREKETFRDLGDRVLLRRYERARREDIASLTLATDGLHRLFALPGTVAQGLRNVGMSLVSAQPFVKRWLVEHALG